MDYALDVLFGRPSYDKLGGPGGPYAVPESPEPGAAWVNAWKTGATVPAPGCDTLRACFEKACAEHGARRALGTRELLETKHDETGKYEKLVLGGYKWLTFKDLAQRVVREALPTTSGRASARPPPPNAAPHAARRTTPPPAWCSSPACSPAARRPSTRRRARRGW